MELNGVTNASIAAAAGPAAEMVEAAEGEPQDRFAAGPTEVPGVLSRAAFARAAGERMVQPTFLAPRAGALGPAAPPAIGMSPLIASRQQSTAPPSGTLMRPDELWWRAQRMAPRESA